MSVHSKRAKLTPNPTAAVASSQPGVPCYELPSEIIGCIFRYCELKTQLLFVGTTKAFSLGAVWSHLHHLELSQFVSYFTKLFEQKGTSEHGSYATRILKHMRPHLGSVVSASLTTAFDPTEVWVYQFGVNLLQHVAPKLKHISVSAFRTDEFTTEAIFKLLDSNTIESISSFGGYSVYVRVFEERKFPRLQHLYILADCFTNGLATLVDRLAQCTGSLVSADLRCKPSKAPGEEADLIKAYKRLSNANKSTLQVIYFAFLPALRLLNLPEDAQALQNVSWAFIDQQCREEFGISLSSLRFRHLDASFWCEVVLSCPPAALHKFDSLRDMCWKNLSLRQKSAEVLYVASNIYRRDRSDPSFCLNRLQTLLDEWAATGSQSVSALMSLCSLAEEAIVKPESLTQEEQLNLESMVEKLKSGILLHRETFGSIGLAPHLLLLLVQDREFVEIAAPLPRLSLLLSTWPHQLKELSDAECLAFEAPLELSGSHVLTCTESVLPEKILLSLVQNSTSSLVSSCFQAFLRVCIKYPQHGAARFLAAINRCFKTAPQAEKVLQTLASDKDTFVSVIKLISSDETAMATFALLVVRAKCFSVLHAIDNAETRENIINTIWQDIFSTCKTEAILQKSVDALVAQLPSQAVTAKLSEFLSNASKKSFQTRLAPEKIKKALASLKT